ncbi:MAG TPA: GWxTD domain-containing protein [Candidatus Polarisedimenticolia bacterium]|nr:GWxTD domain-containing protein [Candidatus Polarisedimenticolia bacterium]
MSTTRRVLPAFVLLASAAGALVNGSSASSLEETSRRWREGPVRYIITASEDREFEKLSSAEGRIRFVETFWARRDPDPSTFVNEFRRQFWERVALANRLFADSAKPGWKTDMGRFYILLGPPDDRDTTREGTLRGPVVWRYSHAPTAALGTGITLVFTRDASGEYRASTDPAVVEEALAQSMAGFTGGLFALGFPLPQIPPSLNELQLMADLGRLQELPTDEDLLTALVSAKEYFGVIPVAARYDHFAGPSGDTLVALTLSLDGEPAERLAAAGAGGHIVVGRLDRIPEGGPPGPPVFLREKEFIPASARPDPGSGGTALYQAVVSLPPGPYRASFAVFDQARRRTGSYTETMDVPAFAAGRLALSSLCLSEAIEPAPDGIEAAPAPYVIGRLRITPRLVPSYRNGETFAVYYQIYRALTDPLTKTSNLSIEYQFFVLQAGAYVPIGRPILFDSVGNTAQGWSFPLRDWPPADFRLRVTVTDGISGQSASREVGFRVL